MNISELSYLDEVLRLDDILCGGYASVTVSASAQVVGERTYAFAKSDSSTRDLPLGGSVGYGYAYAVGVTYTPPTIPTYSVQVEKSNPLRTHR